MNNTDPSGLASFRMREHKRKQFEKKLGSALEQSRTEGTLSKSLKLVKSKLGTEQTIDAVKAGSRTAQDGEEIRTDSQEQRALDNRDTATYYASRSLRGDGYGTRGLKATWNVGSGKFVNNIASFAFEANGRTGLRNSASMFGLNQALARAHAAAVDSDQRGRVRGLLSISQIDDYHEKVFAHFGLSKWVYGGSYFFGLDLGGLNPVCDGCDND